MTAMTDATNALGDTPPTTCPVCTGPCTLPGEGPTGQLGGLCTVCGWDYLVAKGVHSVETLDAVAPDAAGLDAAPIVVDLGAPSAFLDGAHQLAVHHQLGVHPRAAGAEGWIDVVTVDPIGDVLTLLTPEAARRLAAALYDAALRLEASGR